MLHPDQVPIFKLPFLGTKVSFIPPRRAIIRHEAPVRKRLRSVVIVWCEDASVNIELTSANLELTVTPLCFT